MRLRPIFVGWLLVGVPVLLCAQSKPAVSAAKQAVRTGASPSHARVRLLDENDGLAVLGAALETRHKTAQNSDCSHLVHAIYERAGFYYKYEPSRDLYAGTSGDFQRVWQPQAGDLIVWPGHAGVVVNPAQHTFYSALRSGFGVQPYDSVYWKGRGRPRFFRYIKARPSQVLAASREVGLRPAGLSTPDSDDDVSVSADAGDATQQKLEPTPLAPAAPVLVRFARPKSEQVKAALLEFFRAGGGSSAQSQTNQPLAAFDGFDVQKVHVKDNIGWAQIHLRGFVWLDAPEAKSLKPRDTQRFMIRRAGSDGWEMLLPQDAAYLPRELAVKLLAHRLASLADAGSEGNSDQKVLLAHWLNTLLERR